MSSLPSSLPSHHDMNCIINMFLQFSPLIISSFVISQPNHDLQKKMFVYFTPFPSPHLGVVSLERLSHHQLENPSLQLHQPFVCHVCPFLALDSHGLLQHLSICTNCSMSWSSISSTMENGLDSLLSIDAMKLMNEVDMYDYDIF